MLLGYNLSFHSYVVEKHTNLENQIMFNQTYSFSK